MVSITLSVSEQIRELMRKFPEVNWSAVARKSIEEKAKKLALKEEMLKKLKEEDEAGLTEQAIEIGNKIKEGMWKKYKEEGWGK